MGVIVLWCSCRTVCSGIVMLLLFIIVDVFRSLLRLLPFLCHMLCGTDYSASMLSSIKVCPAIANV